MQQSMFRYNYHHPVRSSWVQIVLGVLLLASGLNVHADIFRCTDDDGHVIFTQKPCHASQQSEKLHLGKLDENSKPTAKVCAQVEKLANLLFPHINDTDSILDIYGDLGGRKYLSAGISAVVNYVFNFRFNPKARQVNVVALTHAKCLDGGFGRLTQKDLPDWDRIKYAKQKAAQDKSPNPHQQAQCTEYDQKISALQSKLAGAKDKSKQLQARVDLEYYNELKRQQCRVATEDRAASSPHESK